MTVFQQDMRNLIYETIIGSSPSGARRGDIHEKFNYADRDTMNTAFEMAKACA